MRVDLLDQVVRHRLLQRRAAHQDRHRLGLPGQVDGRLAGRVGPADDVDVLVGAAGRLGQRRAVVDPASGQLGQAGRGELPVGHPGGEDDGVRVDRGAVGEPDRPGRAVDLQADHLAGGQHLGAELGRLPPGPVGELRAGHPVGEAEVVLDPGALAGLAAGRGPLDQHGPQPLGGAVDRRAEAGRAAADDDEVVEVGRRRGRQAHLARQLRVRGLHQHLAVRRDHHRQPQPVRAGRVEQPPALRPRRTRTSGRAPGCGPGTRVPRTSAPTSGARRPWSRAPAGSPRTARPPAARPPPGRASPPADPRA